jgi:hypothetical protein
MSHDHRHEPDSGDKSKSRTKWVFVGFVAIAAYFLIAEHKAHLYGWLSAYGIWLLLLACPLLHMFHGHGGHGGHGGGDKRDKSDEGPKP